MNIKVLPKPWGVTSMTSYLIPKLLLVAMTFMFFATTGTAQIKIGNELEKINAGAILQLESMYILAEKSATFQLKRLPL